MRLLLLSRLVIAVGATPHAATYVVHPDGTGDFPIVQAAVDAAVDGDIIELADGIFMGDDNRDIDYLGKAITAKLQSGNPEACVFDCEGHLGEGDWGFLFQNGEGWASVLEGVAVAKSRAGEGGGAGIYCSHSSPTITNCSIRGSCVVSGGGGMCCLDHSAPTLTAVTFTQNVASGFHHRGSGGGMYCWDSSSPEVTDCSLTSNAGSDGGMYCWGGSPTFVDVVFLGNRREPGWVGGGGLYAGGSATLSRCTFSDNGVFVEGRGLFCDGSPVVADCTFSGNQAWRGGGISCRGTRRFTGCTLIANEIISGNAIVHISESSSPTLENTIIGFGIAGLAVSCDAGANATLLCCDVYGNEGGDWVGCIADQYGGSGNISADPLFCDPENRDFRVDGNSPCSPLSPPNEECDLIGAWSVRCGSSPVEVATGGRIKAIFRR